MNRNYPLLSIGFKIFVLVSVAGAAHWLGYRQGSLSSKLEDKEISQTSQHKEDVPPVLEEKPETTNQDQDNAVAQSPQEVYREAISLENQKQNRFPKNLIAEAARNLSASDALQLVLAGSEILDNQRGPALKMLVSEWIANNGQLTPNEAAQWQRRIRSLSGGRFGLEVELGMALARSNVSNDVSQAWMQAFSDHPGRSRMFASLMANQFQSDPLSVLENTTNWTDWERSRFERNLFRDWAQQSPDAALDWYADNRHLVEESVGKEIFDTISSRDPLLASELLPSIQNEEQRLKAIEGIAASLAKIGTEEAIDWVDTLEEETERDIAMEAVYEATPRGIGAMLGRQDGFPLIMELIPGGPLESSGLVPGDMIVQARESGGDPVDLHGLNLGAVVQRLRGEPGSDVEIRILRKNSQTAQLEEHQVRVTRDLLLIHPKEKNG